MKDVAKLMNLQIKIDQLLITKKNGEKLSDTLITELNQDYQYLSIRKGVRNKYGIEWIKNSANSKAFKGTLHDFIIQRGKDLGVDLEMSKNLAQADFKAQPSGLFKKISNIIGQIFDSIQSIYSVAWKGICYLGLIITLLMAMPFAVLA